MNFKDAIIVKSSITTNHCWEVCDVLSSMWPSVDR